MNRVIEHTPWVLHAQPRGRHVAAEPKRDVFTGALTSACATSCLSPRTKAFDSAATQFDITFVLPHTKKNELAREGRSSAIDGSDHAFVGPTAVPPRLRGGRGFRRFC